MRDELPAQIPADVREEIERFCSRLGEHDSCLATGSLVEGFGNANSDIDLYVISAGAQGNKGQAIGLRKNRYVDCEYMSLAALRAVITRVATAGWGDLARSLGHTDFDRYYRLAIAARLTVAPAVHDALQECSKEIACDRYAMWAVVQAHAYLSRAAVALSAGNGRLAAILLREAALLRAASILAAHGEGYPSLKWTWDKAARCFATDERARQDCLQGCLGLTDNPSAELARLRQLIALPSTALKEVMATAYQLGADVHTVRGEGGTCYLVKGKTTMAELSGPTAVMCSNLAETSSWHGGLAAVADQFRVSEAEAQACLLFYTRSLHSGGFLQAVT